MATFLIGDYKEAVVVIFGDCKKEILRDLEEESDLKELKKAIEAVEKKLSSNGAIQLFRVTITFWKFLINFVNLLW